MAEPTESTTKLQLGRVRSATSTLQDRTTTNQETGQDEATATVLSWNAEASISEEPGAGKPHAGFCAGAVG